LKSIWAEPLRIKGSEVGAEFDKEGGDGGVFRFGDIILQFPIDF